MTIQLEDWQEASAYIYRNCMWDMDDAKSITYRLEDKLDVEHMVYLEARRASILRDCCERQDIAASHSAIAREKYENEYPSNPFFGIPTL